MVLNGKKVRVIDLSKILDPKTESRRCSIRRFNTGGPIPDFHTDMDLTTHLGTHVEAPFHHNSDWKDVVQLPVENFLGRCVYLKFDFLPPRAHLTAEALDKVAAGRVGEGDIVIIDSNYPLPPFTDKTNTDEDNRLLIGEESARWFAAKKVKSIGFGDGVSIENCVEDVAIFHTILMKQDVTFIEVLKNLDQLESEVFFLSFLPLPIKGIDSSPVRVVAIEGLI